MNRADARAAEHGHGGFGNHRHVDRHAVALLDAERFQDVGELADLRVQFRVGDALHVLLRFALPDDGGLVAARLEMAVEAVHRDVELAVVKPGVLDFPRGGVPVELARVPGRLEPLQRLRLFQPEFLRLAEGALIQRVVLRGVEERVLHDFRRRRERAAFVLQRFGGNGLVWRRHGDWIARHFRKIRFPCQSAGKNNDLANPRSGASAERRNLCREFFKWRLSPESRYAGTGPKEMILLNGVA